MPFELRPEAAAGGASVLGPAELAAVRAVTDAERTLVRAPRDELARVRLEAAVGALGAQPDILCGLIAWVAGSDARAAGATDAGSDEAVYGAVRAWYWLALLRGRDGGVDEVRASLGDALEALVALEARRAELLVDNLELVLAEVPLARSEGLVRRLVELARLHPARASAFTRLAVAASAGGEPAERALLARDLVARAVDLAALESGLRTLQRVDSHDGALRVARDAFERVDVQGRALLARAVVRTAPPEFALGFVLERAHELAHAPLVWIELGERDGIADLLVIAYAEARERETDAEFRQLLVAASARVDRHVLRAVAAEDPSAAVRAQAALVLSARADAELEGRDLDAVVAVLRTCDGLALATGLWAAQNVFAGLDDAAQRPTARAARTRLVEALTDVALDAERERIDRERVVIALAPHLPAQELAWLGDQVASTP